MAGTLQHQFKALEVIFFYSVNVINNFHLFSKLNQATVWCFQDSGERIYEEWDLPVVVLSADCWAGQEKLTEQENGTAG
jgi:hypothetical protein